MRNIYSVDYALKRLGVEAIITSDKETLMSADKIIFPGVGGCHNHEITSGSINWMK